MKHYQQMMARQRKWMLYLLALLVLGWGLTPWEPIFLGLLLGSALSFYNLWLMQRKIRKLGEASAENKSVRGIGTFTRLASGALAVVIALQFEEHIHLISVVLGLMAAYIVIFIDYLFNKSTV
ncbi:MULTISPECIES: ATP synthase subunit I [Halobacillus]|uniref:F0F1 ATP synthase subunit I n=1 Tax=Halobacillus halophilus (strain ATCC 35676 / DSM 2266 / JCM 20832 / KCTC 3685 / LMG 17431 / NBRC 102448 / NCIMB 2269) TaxID=866895 RepID=I0JS20_HALH3|nr:ATP synthase subunit I [Halobacillus halophilus]ASF40889.1 ATP synthase subunit I [Halobacillus halophilus]CCG46941.1 F0F1 ATP synthase subunit I [Halobacillus halophilus DSM 2266]